MTHAPSTRDSLLLQVKDPEDREAWDEFVEIYQPVILRTAMARGLQDADAHDLSQQVLIAVAGAIGRWKREDQKVRFRHWLRRVTKNATINALTRGPKDVARGGWSVLDRLVEIPANDNATEELMELEYRRELYLHAVEIVRENVNAATWEAFEMTVINDVAMEEAVERLGTTIGKVYAARSRVMRRLRVAVRKLEKAES